MSRARRIAVRALATLLVTAAVAAVVVYVASARRLTRVYRVPPVSVAAAAGADTARGRHLATAVMVCVECHGADLGGRLVEDVPPFRIAAPNLTRGRGGIGAARSDADLARAVRHGVRPDGTPLLLMPSDAYAAVADADLAALVAYIRSAPPVDRETGPNYLKPLGRALLVAGVLDELAAERIDHTRRADTRPPGDSLAEGRYLANVAGCAFCHTPSFGGRAEAFGPPGAPVPPPITRAALAGWSEADFARALRTGRRPDGRVLSTFMPWRQFARMTDNEIHALWLALGAPPSSPTAHPAARR